jgi:hypothetical protein
MQDDEIFYAPFRAEGQLMAQKQDLSRYSMPPPEPESAKRDQFDQQRQNDLE